MSSIISKMYGPNIMSKEELSVTTLELEEELQPISVVLETTFQCNMRCIHCGTSCGEKKSNELTLQEHYKLADDLVYLGLKDIFLSGGEALLNPDWKKIATYYADRGVRVVLLSNGLLIPKKIDELKDSPIDQIGISIDGLKSTHDRIRKVNGSYDIALKAIELLDKHTKIMPSIITTVSKWNINEIENLYKIFNDHGCKLWQLQRVFPMGRMNKDFILDFKDVLFLHEFLHEKREQKKLNPTTCMEITGACDTTPFSKYKTKEIVDDYFGCPAGLLCLGIEADGSVKGCLTQSKEFVEGNIREESLIDIWRNSNNFTYNRYFHEDKVKTGCNGCSYLEDCRCGCTIQAFSETNDRYNQIYCLHSTYFQEYLNKNK
ncbi:MAG: radical SAM protein [Oligoflexia bacterium]|nr:radical SAM protein [Oligoflexia bacterium]